MSVSLLAVAFFIVQFFSAVSGGAGLIERPLLILAGLPPHIATASARAAHLGMRLITLWQFHKHEKIDWKLAAVLIIPSVVGGLLGAQLVAYLLILGESLLRKIMGSLILAMGVLLLVKKRLGIQPSPVNGLFTHAAGVVSVATASALTTITGGESVLVSYMLMTIYKKTYIAAVTLWRVINYGGAIASTLFFLQQGFVDWSAASLVLLFGGAGGYFGVRYGIRKGEEWVRKITLIVIFLLGTYLVFS